MTTPDHAPDLDPMDGLNSLLEQARQSPPAVPDALLTRVQADALAHQPTAGLRASPSTAGRVRSWLQALGGWPTLAGLGAAGLAGVWIGVAAPDMVVAPFGLTQDADTFSVDPLSGFDFAAAEG